LAFDPPLAGTVTDTVALPPVQETVRDNPTSFGDDENTQFFVPDTVAKSCTDPPASGSAVGVAVNEAIFGSTTNGLIRGRAAGDTVFGA
jgi:hypothetical protein